MTRSHRIRKSKAQAAHLPVHKNKDLGTSKAPPTSKQAALKKFRGAFKNQIPSVAPEDQVGLLVTNELTKAKEECRTKVAQIVKGCRAANRRFRDAEFDLKNDKIRCLSGLTYGFLGSKAPPAVLRLTQIFEKPQFLVDGAEASDIIQGKLGDCWLLSALATMSTSKGLIEKLCVERDEEVGVYGFVFFRDSNWVHVIIDDQLFWSSPKYEELSAEEQKLYRYDKEAYDKFSRHGGKGLYYSRSGTEGETWVPLIEKAYAKLHGCYQSLNGGISSDAIEDLTGGVSVTYTSNDILDKDKFWKEELLHATKDRLFGCSFDQLDTSRKSDGINAPAPRVNGLFGGHAYSILRVKECKGKRFVVIRNPWGNSEWTGAWADGSKEWVGEWLDVLKELDHVFGDDGEFVMEYSDFLDTFQQIERTTIFDLSWVMSSHWLRLPPQRRSHPWSHGDVSFNFVLSKPSFTIISLSQLDTRYFKEISGASAWNIDFVVYKRGDKGITGVSYYAAFHARSVTCELSLEAGEYVIFPRCDREYTEWEEPECFKAARERFDKRHLTRVLTERAKSRSIAANLLEGAGTTHFPTSIETLIEHDLEKLKEEGKLGVVEVDTDRDVQEKLPDTEEERNKQAPDGAEKTGEPEKAESDENVESDEENKGKEGSPGPSNEDKEHKDEDEGEGEDGDEYHGEPYYSDDEDSGSITLGVRIYTKGKVVVSVTGHVIGEGGEDRNKKAT